MSDREHQNWLKIDGGTAWHLIERHSESWQQINEMMNECINAHVQAATKAQEEKIKELTDLLAEIRPMFNDGRAQINNTLYEKTGREWLGGGIFTWFDRVDQAIAISKEVKDASSN
jgi:hypothetical protein